MRSRPEVNRVAIYIYRKKLVGGRKECNDSERDASTEEQVQVSSRQYLCHSHGTVSPAIAKGHDVEKYKRM